MTAALTRGQLAKRAFVDALNPVFTRAGDAITPSGILRASLKSGPRSRRLRAALLALPGLDVERPAASAIGALSAWLKDHGSIDGTVYRLRRREGVGSRRAGYWLELIEQSPIGARLAHLADEEQADERAPAEPVPAESTPDAPVTRVLVEPTTPASVVPAAAAAEPAAETPEAPIVYQDGRVRGQRHRDRIARAAVDAPAAIRTPDARPMRLQPMPSVFAQPSDDDGPRDAGPVDWLPQMRWKP